jgi:hypothetical protein
VFSPPVEGRPGPLKTDLAPLAREQPIQQGNERGGEEQRIHQPLRHVVGELQPGARAGHEHGKQHARAAPVGRCLGIGNHEEGEHEQSAGLHLLHRDRQRIAEIESAGEQDDHVRPEEGDGDVASLGAGKHKAGKADEQSGARHDRPVLDKALATLEKGDTLACLKLDRLGRSLAHLVSVIEDLDARGIHS